MPSVFCSLSLLAFNGSFYAISTKFFSVSLRFSHYSSGTTTLTNVKNGVNPLSDSRLYKNKASENAIFCFNRPLIRKNGKEITKVE